MGVANTLAYYDTKKITALKSFIVQAPGLMGLDERNKEDEQKFYIFETN